MPLPVSIGDPADLIAAVPAMLGFTPVRSLVLIFLKHETPCGGPFSAQLVVRMESPLDKDRMSDTEIAHRAVRLCGQVNAFAVLAVLVDDRLSRLTEPASADERYWSVLKTLDQHLDSVDLTLGGAWGARFIATNAEWWNHLAPERHGYLPDPAASPIAAEHVSMGRQIRHSRAELTDLVKVDVALRDRVQQVLPDVAADAHLRLARTVGIGNPEAYSRQALWQVMRTIKDSSALELPAPRTIAQVAVALRDTAVRDAMFGVAAGAHAARAEQLWSILTRALPDPDRAEAATLWGFSAYLRGDGPLAGIAVQAAVSSDPGHRMAQLLDIAISSALPPRKLDSMCDAAIDVAAQLRIDIGATEPDSHTKEHDDDQS